MGVSVDHVPCLKAWADSLGGVSFPLLSDFWPHGEAARAWGVFREEDGTSERAIFVIDAEGVVRYVDVHDIADQPDNEVLFGELAKIAPRVEPSQDVAATSGGMDAAAAEAAGVVMYCRTWCPDCMRARQWLDAQGIPYVEVDVDADAEARARAAEHNAGALHTPTFEIGDRVCVDFKPDVITALIARL